MVKNKLFNKNILRNNKCIGKQHNIGKKSNIPIERTRELIKIGDTVYSIQIYQVSSITFKTCFDFTHTSFEVVQASITLQHNTLHFFCLYRPPPNRRNNLTDYVY